MTERACVRWLALATGAEIYSAPLTIMEALQSAHHGDHEAITKGVVFRDGTPEFAEAERRWAEHMAAKVES